MIRKTGFILVIVVPVISLLTLYFLRNVLVTGIAERSLAAMLGTEVSVDGVNLNPLAMTAEFRRLRIVNADDPAKYLLTAGPGKFAMNGLQLFAARVIVDTMQVENVGLGVPIPSDEVRPVKRPTPPPPSAPAEKPAQQTPGEKKGLGFDFEMPKLNLDALGGNIDVDALTGKKDLASMKALDDAERENKARLERLNAAYKTGNFEARYKQLEAEYKALNFDSNNPQALQKSLEGLKKVSAEAQTLNRDINQFSKSMGADYAAMRGSYGNVDKQVAADIASVRSLANLGNLGLSNIGPMLFGKEVLSKFDWFMAQFDRVKTMLRSDDKQVQKKPRRRAGRIVTYPVTGRAYPRFLIENISFTGFTPDATGGVAMRFSGRLAGLSSDARVYGKPMLLEARASRTGKESWAILGTFDHRGEQGSDRVTASGTDVDLGEINMGGGDMLPQKALARNGSVTLDFGLIGNQLDGSLVIKANHMTFVFDRPLPKGNSLAASVREIFQGIDDADVTAKLKGPFSHPQFSVDTSIDDVLSRRMQQALNQRMAAADRAIREQITGRVEARRKEIDAALAAQGKDLQQSVSQIQQQSDAVNKQLEQQKKAAEAKLNAALKKAAGDKLKGLLK